MIHSSPFDDDFIWEITAVQVHCWSEPEYYHVSPHEFDDWKDTQRRLHHRTELQTNGNTVHYFQLNGTPLGEKSWTV